MRSFDWKQEAPTNHEGIVDGRAERLKGLWGRTYDNVSCYYKTPVDTLTSFNLCITSLLHRLDERGESVKCVCAVMEDLTENDFERCEQFGDWSTFSSEHWDVNHRDSAGFGDWGSFNEGLSEESASADLSSQEEQISGHEHKVFSFTL